MKRELVVDIVGVSEKRNIHAMGDDLGLLPERHGEFESVVDCSRGLRSRIRDHVIQFGDHASLFRRVEPDLVPVLVFDGLNTASNHVNHELSCVGFGGTLSSILAKVMLHGCRIVTDISEVDGLSALGKKKKSVELSKELSRGLMNCNLKKSGQYYKTEINCNIEGRLTSTA